MESREIYIRRSSTSSTITGYLQRPKEKIEEETESQTQESDKSSSLNHNRVKHQGKKWFNCLKLDERRYVRNFTSRSINPKNR